MSPVSEKKTRSRRIALAVIVFVIGAAIVLPRFRGAARHEIQGTIIQIDVGARRATLEYIDSANGATREVTGEVPPKCTITINGNAATLADLRISDIVLAQGQVDRRKKAGTTEMRIVADEMRVIRRKTNE